MKTKRKTWVRVNGAHLANDWARPVIVALSWLQDRRLLTAAGRRMMRSPFEHMALTSDCVTDTGRRFLDDCWKKWYSERGMWLAFMGYGNAKENYAYLDALYAQWEHSQQAVPTERRSRTAVNKRTPRARRR